LIHGGNLFIFAFNVNEEDKEKVIDRKIVLSVGISVNDVVII
jgi:hypothetical protein